MVGMIHRAFGDDRVSTFEATDRLDSQFGYRCPDDIVKTLTKLRRAGLVKGEISMERGGWIWWVDDECRSKAREGLQ